MKKTMLLLLSVVALLLSYVGCAAYVGSTREVPQKLSDSGYDLYFMEPNFQLAAGGGALRAERFIPPEGTDLSDKQQLAELLIQTLLQGPTEFGLNSAIPTGTSLLSLDIRGTEAVVDFSTVYAGLSGIALTMADYAVAMTLTQLPGIYSVRITVHGRELVYRDNQVFTRRDVLLAPEGDVLGTVAVKLYFLTEKGVLHGEERTLELYEGDTQVAAVTRALENGPQSKALLSVWPENFRVRAVWQEEEVCYVNLSSAMLESLPEKTRVDTTLRALHESLRSLRTVEEVRFLVDGEFTERYGSIRLDGFSQ